MAAVFLSETARPAASQTVTMTCHFNDSFLRRRANACAVVVHYAPHGPSYACQRLFGSASAILLKVNQILYDAVVLAEPERRASYGRRTC